MGEVLKLLLLKEKEQMVLGPGGDGHSHAWRPSASCVNCDAKRNGMRRTARTRRGAELSGLRSPGHIACPFHPWHRRYLLPAMDMTPTHGR